MRFTVPNAVYLSSEVKQGKTGAYTAHKFATLGLTFQSMDVNAVPQGTNPNDSGELVVELVPGKYQAEIRVVQFVKKSGKTAA